MNERERERTICYCSAAKCITNNKKKKKKKNVPNYQFSVTGHVWTIQDVMQLPVCLSLATNSHNKVRINEILINISLTLEGTPQAPRTVQNRMRSHRQSNVPHTTSSALQCGKSPFTLSPTETASLPERSLPHPGCGILHLEEEWSIWWWKP